MRAEESDMRAIQLTARVNPDHTLMVAVPPDLAPGEYRVVVVIGEAAAGPAASTEPLSPPVHDAGLAGDFPVIDVGPWPEGLSLRREDMYGDDGR
jgi:hypothetical protein